MKTSLYKLVLLSGLFFSGALILTSCSKADAVNSISSQSLSQGKMANALFDHNLIVTYAKDNGADITNQFQGITFNLMSSATNNGYVTAANDLFAVNGTWIMPNGTLISFAFPTNGLPVLSFMNKEWNIVSYNDPVILTAANGEDDEIRMTLKK